MDPLIADHDDTGAQRRPPAESESTASAVWVMRHRRAGRRSGRRRGHIVGVALALGVAPVLAACGSSSSSSTTTTKPSVSPSAHSSTTTTAAPTTTTSGVTAVPGPTSGTLPIDEVTTGTVPGLGTVLVAGNGFTLYMFVPDKRSGVSTCYNACATAWPPLLLAGTDAPIYGHGVNPGLLGTTKRTDGTVQVTYNGWPLYLWVSDSEPGQATGQAINNDGGLWYVLNPAGQVVTKKVS
jgi:predicted lipoprotein with Yx(FWY)xxD motif